MKNQYRVVLEDSCNNFVLLDYFGIENFIVLSGCTLPSYLFWTLYVTSIIVTGVHLSLDHSTRKALVFSVSSIAVVLNM